MLPRPVGNPLNQFICELSGWQVRMGGYKFFKKVPAKEFAGSIGGFDDAVGIQYEPITGFETPGLYFDIGHLRTGPG